jgi:hypothetical protein
MDLLIILTYVAIAWSIFKIFKIPVNSVVGEAVVYRFLFQVRRGPYSPYAACPSRAQVGTLCGGEINYGSVDNFDLRGYRLVDI